MKSINEIHHRIPSTQCVLQEPHPSPIAALGASQRAQPPAVILPGLQGNNGAAPPGEDILIAVREFATSKWPGGACSACRSHARDSNLIVPASHRIARLQQPHHGANTSSPPPWPRADGTRCTIGNSPISYNIRSHMAAATTPQPCAAFMRSHNSKGQQCLLQDPQYNTNCAPPLMVDHHLEGHTRSPSAIVPTSLWTTVAHGTQIAGW
ncbi:hypothetical protein BD779DRAFT_1672764 [Infundibulicybe gibba]|nr:hypothetical protein BD779DRAFT_1672764 [Infundibulicybe gibba]